MTDPLFSRSRRVEIRLYFTTIVFYIIFVTMVLVGGGCLLLVGSGAGSAPMGYIPIILACLVSVVVGSALSAYISDRIFAPVLRLSAASKLVAQGDFSIRLDTETPINEIRETCESFNTMVQGLGEIETLRNDFVANVSHEFKTPITAIQGYAMLLQDPGLEAGEREDCVARILCNTDRLAALVGNILTLSKIENQSLTLTRAPFRLDEQIRRAIVTLEPKWAAKGIELDAELDSLVYNGCEGLLAQVWSNLIDNAVKFSPVGGTVSLTAAAAGDWVQVSVADQGPGLDEEILGHIFEKFYQGDTSHRSEGNGLGLTLVQEITALHGGSVEAANREGGGAIFTVKLRAAAGAGKDGALRNP